MTPRDRTRSSSKTDARHCYDKSREFLRSMECDVLSERWDAAGLSAIHAGIAAADAVLSYHGGIRSAGQDHRVVVDLLVEVLGPVAAAPAKHLSRLIAKKNLVEYEQRRLLGSEGEELVMHARRFLKWASGQLPQEWPRS